MDGTHRLRFRIYKYGIGSKEQIYSKSDCINIHKCVFGNLNDYIYWAATIARDESGYLHYEGRLYVPDAKDLRLRILKDKHNHLLAGHFGINKTTELVRREYTWPGVRKFVNDFCSHWGQGPKYPLGTW